MKTSKESNRPTMKFQKITKDWYRIVIQRDKWDLATSVVDVYRTRFNEWSVNEGEPDLGLKLGDRENWVFIKFGSAKLFAIDLAQAVKDETSWPSLISGKYSDY